MNTTITIKKETHQKLQSLGKKGQTFDDVVSELLQKGDSKCQN